MKTYKDLVVKEEEIEGEYNDECPQCDMEQPDGDEAPSASFSLNDEYKTKIENSLSKLEEMMNLVLDSTLRFKVEECGSGIKISANASDSIKAKLFSSVKIESNCVNNFEKESNTGHSITKFFFKAIIGSKDGSEVEVNIPNNEYWFDFDLNDWMVIKK